MIHLATGVIADGKLKVDARELMLDELSQWHDGPVIITIKEQRATRSQQANAYYWAVVVKHLAARSGHAPDEIHDALKTKFLSKEIAIADDNGEVVAEFVIGGSTQRLDSNEFYDYIERIRQWALESLNLFIPPPDQLWRLADNKEQTDEDR